MDHIAVIIVHYNTPRETREAVESVINSNLDNLKVSILVVDNGSRKPLSFPQQFADQGVEILRSEANLGFTGGNNLGISHAVKKFQSDYFFLLNSDAVLESETLKNLISFATAHPQSGLICPKIYFQKGSEFHARSYERSMKGAVIWYAGGSIDWKALTAFHRGVDEFDRGQFDHGQETDFATGCAVLIRREVVERIGILDKRYFLYFEDVDYSLRAKKAGFKIYLCPNGVVWHLNASSTQGSGSDFQQYYQTRNRLLLAAKFGNLKIKLLALRLLLTWLVSGNSLEKRASIDFCLLRFGKQPIA